MILKPKFWDSSDIQTLLEQHKLTREQFQTLTGIDSAVLSRWMDGKKALSVVERFALDRIERLLNEFFRKHGAQSRPGHVHGMDLVTNSPGVGVESVHGYPYEMVLQPGMTLMLEPCPITADGLLGLFYGHTFIITETGHDRLTKAKEQFELIQ